MNAVKNKEDITRYGFGFDAQWGDSDRRHLAAGWLQMCQESSRTLSSRLGIPLIYGVDAVHGHNNVEGRWSSRTTSARGHAQCGLVRKAARSRARGGRPGHTGRSHRALRRAESALGARTRVIRNPEVCGMLARQRLRGCSGNCREVAALAGAKHYAGDGGTRDGIDQGDTVCDETTFRRLHVCSMVRRFSRFGNDHGVLQQLERAETARAQRLLTEVSREFGSQDRGHATGRRSISFSQL